MKMEVSIRQRTMSFRHSESLQMEKIFTNSISDRAIISIYI